MARLSRVQGVKPGSELEARPNVLIWKSEKCNSPGLEQAARDSSSACLLLIVLIGYSGNGIPNENKVVPITKEVL